MVPVHKSGSTHKVENYRGISILNCLAKLLERFVYDLIKSTTDHIVSECQHGFVGKRSTVTNMMVFVPFVSQSLTERYQVDAIYIDFAKAFDRLSHDIIVSKMHHLGFPLWLCTWLRSYLVDRKAFVKCGTVSSDTFAIKSGVPQGSHLGPLLFTLSINDICVIIRSEKILFADDLKIYRKIKDSVDCVALQNDLQSLNEWCKVNRMQVNVKKTKVISFYRSEGTTIHQYTLESTVIDRVTSIRDLGIIVDKSLTFKEHLSVTISKAITTLGFIIRNTKDFDDVYVLKTLYCSLVRSILEYAIQIWAPRQIGELRLLESVQKRFLRYALRSLPWNDPIRLPPYLSRCQLIRLESLGGRSEMLRRLFIFDLLQGNINCSSLLAAVPIHAPTRSLREFEFLRIPNYGHRTFFNPFVECCRLFNDVYYVFDFNVSKTMFKDRIRNNAQSER